MLAACGFHLRGMLTLPESMKRMAVISNNNDSPLRQELVEALKVAGVTVVPVGESAFILSLLDENFTSTISGISASTNTRQYTMAYRVNYQLMGPNAASIIPPSSLQTVRSLTVDANQILGSNSQEFTIKQEMRQELIQKILSRLSSKQTKAQLG